MHSPKETYGEKEIQLNYGVESNHLGNVLATVSARPRLMYDNQTFTHKEPDVTSVSDYYPGGFPQPGRSFNLGSYRFGHNQQESDPEITGSWGSIYTAEYWMYDSRINWRWNPDPVIKPWQSPYSCFSGNPIWRIDPNGDDDFFNSKGEYMGSTTEGTKIRVVNDNITFENAVKSVENNTKLIAEIDYSRENMGNIKMLLNVQTHYASQVGINQNVSKIMYREGAESGEAAFYYKENFGVVIDKGTNKISSQFNDIYNTKNLWVHEKGHKDDPETGKPLGHVQLVIDQSTHETFEKTTDKFKYGMFKYTEFLLNKAIEQGTGMYGINKMIDAVNNSALGNTGFLFYDEENKRVSSAITLDPVEVGGNK